MRAEARGGRHTPPPSHSRPESATPSAGSARRDEVLARLDEGIAGLTESSRWSEWLRVQARFHRYSFSNTLLIQLQRPGSTRVAGYRTWQKLGRQVMRGEPGIAILAPVVRRVRAKSGADLGDDGDQVPAAIRRVATFVVAWVWDVSQTQGDAPLPEVCSRLTGEDTTGAYERLLGVAAGLGYAVAEADLPGETNGECSPAERRIRVRRGLAARHRVKVLAHELGHALLHEEGYAGTPRPLAELEAESVAFIVCDSMRVDSGDYSFAYVATWAGGGDEARAALRASAQRIQRAAAQIIDAAGVAEEVAVTESAA